MHSPSMPFIIMTAKSVYASMITDTWIPSSGVCSTGCKGGLGVTTLVITSARIAMIAMKAAEYSPLRCPKTDCFSFARKKVFFWKKKAIMEISRRA